MMLRTLSAIGVALAAGLLLARAEAPPAVAPGVPRSITLQPVAIYDAAGNIVGSFGGGGTSGVTRTRLTCTLPAYATGGNIVCTDQAGAQTTTACAANTACLVAAANPARKTAFVMNRTPGVSLDMGYAATVAPGTGIGIDGPTSGPTGQGGFVEENPAHVGPYYAASSSAATLVFVQGQ